MGSNLYAEAYYEMYHRHLPHFNKEGAYQFLTFRLADSLPQQVLKAYKAEKVNFLNAHPLPWDEETEKTYTAKFTKRMNDYLDAGYGSCLLRTHEAARIVERTLHFYNGKKYELLAFVIMPNHLHLLILQYDTHTLANVMHAIKSYSASQINKALARQGRLWMPETFDRAIRNEQHFYHSLRYIWRNANQGGIVLYDKFAEWKQEEAAREKE